MKPVAKAACFRCNKVQNTIDMRLAYFGVHVCADKAKCPGMKSPIKSL